MKHLIGGELPAKTLVVASALVRIRFAQAGTASALQGSQHEGPTIA